MSVSSGLQLTRVEIAKVGQVCRRAMRVLPGVSDGGTQRVVAGDASGAVACLGLRRGDIEQRYRTLPLGSGAVTRIEVGAKDRVFAAVGAAVVGVGRSGKEFFRLETGLAEPIGSVSHAAGDNLFVAGDYSFYRFVAGDDKDYYLCPERINDMVVARVTSDSDLDAVLACQDRSLRLLQGSELLFQTEVDGPATALLRFDPPESRPSDPRVLIYGTATGVLGCVALDNTGFAHRWTVAQPGAPSSAAITCITAGEWAGDGCRDIAVGRDDGSVDVFTFPDRSTRSGTESVPTLSFHAQLPESIQAIDSGQIVAPKFVDIVVASFSGHIVAFSPDVRLAPGNASERERSDHEFLTGDEEARRKIRAEEEAVHKLEASLAALKQETEQKQAEIQQRKTKQKKQKKQHPQKKKKQPSTPQQPAPHLPPAPVVNARMVLVPADACHRLTIECADPIEFVGLHCDAPIAIDEVDRESCSVATTESSPSELLATVRVSGSSGRQRVELRVRFAEGLKGVLQVFVAPSGSAGVPRGGRVLTLPIKPLALHERASASLTAEEQARPMSALTVDGSFSLSEFHAWMCMCFPALPERLASDVEASYVFRSVLTSAVVQCTYKRGHADIRSDSLPALAAVKDFVTQISTERQTRAKMGTSVNEESIAHLVRLVHARCESLFIEQQRFLLLGPLRELQVHEADALSFLSPDLADIAAHSDEIRAAHPDVQRKLELLFGVIVALFRSLQTLGTRPQNPARESELRQVLSQYSLERVLAFFEQ